MAADEVTKEPRRIRVRLIAGIVLVVLAAVGLWVWHTYGRESTDDAQIDGHITPIAARVGGTVETIDVHDNEPVHKGDRLVQIDQRDYQLALQHAEAVLADAEANAQALHVGVPMTSTTTQGDVSTAQAAVDAARSAVNAAGHAVAAAKAHYVAAQANERAREADAVKASKDLDRLAGLIKKDEISQQHYDAAVAAATAARAGHDAAVADAAAANAGVTVAESQLAQAKAALVKAQADYTSAKSGTQQVAVDQARVKAAEARVEQAKAALGQAKLNLAYTTIVAPADGIVSKKSIEPGQVDPGRPAAAGHRAARGSLGDGELQGDPARPDAAGTARHRVGRRARRPDVPGTRRQHRRGHGRAIQPAAARERHRQLREGGPARAGEDRAREGAGSAAPAAPGHVGGADGVYEVGIRD